MMRSEAEPRLSGENRTSGFGPILLALCLMAGAGHGQYLETTIPVGNTPTDLLWNPVSNKVYCANNQDDNVTVIDGETNQVIAVVEVGEYPTFLAWNSRENKVYCACGEDNKVAVIDGQGDTLVRMLRIRDYPGVMSYNAAMNKLYVACHDNGLVTVVDAGPDTVLSTIQVTALGSIGLLWHPMTNRLFCSLGYEDSAKVIDCETDEIVVRMALGDRPSTWCWNPVNNLVYLTSRYAVHVLSSDGNSVIAEVPVYGRDLCFAPYPNKVYAVSGLTFVIDGSTNVVAETIPVAGSQLVCDTVAGKVYSVHLNGEQLHIIDARADTLVKSIPLGRYPYGICWNRTDSRVYIADCMDDVVYVIRDTTSGIAEPELYAGPARAPATVLVSQSYVYQEPENAGLVDACGRRVAVLEPGRNDLGRLAPGVYALVSADGALRCKIVKVR